MHIKQVIISGFRSFRSQSEIEPFSPKHNVIVGRNGSGKSNFFDAIQFVLLGPKFANLRQEDRQQLLHEGAGSSVMAAYVEIIFDNSDGRLSVESDEVVLRRTVGHKKDEFFLNRKRVQKSEVVSLLESAGFSKSNPYYIVQQGKVSNLCVMKDKDRLELLKEVAGTTVYEERRSESLKIIQDSLTKQVQIDEVLQFIEDRLNELEQEKDELREYDQLDKKRRALEFNIYDKELNKANDSLREMELTREEEREQQQNLYSNLRDIQDDLQVEEDNLLTSKAAFERLANRRQSKVAEISEALARKSSTEVEILELEAALKAQTVEQAELIKQLSEVSQAVSACEGELAIIEPLFEEQRKNISTSKEESEWVKNRVEALYGKQGRGRQFRNKEERDSFLQKQIDKLKGQITEQESLHARISREVTSAERTVMSEMQQLTKAEEEQRSRTTNYDEVTKTIQDKVKKRNELQDQRKSKWRELEVFQEKIQDVRQELERGKQQLNSSIPRYISQGLAMAEQVAAEMNLEGYYGPLIDNFELKNDAFRTAVEVAAGNALFYIIVDTDATASIIIKELDRRKAGRLTFLPLNRLRMEEVTYPDSNDVRSLVDVALNFDVEYEVAIREVFGRKLLARDLDIAAHFSKEFGLDAITKDGDLVSSKGGFEGGYRDERDSKIGAVVKIREATGHLTELIEKEAELKQESEAVENQVNETMRELQKLETERDHLKSSSEQLSKELSNRRKAVQSLQAGLQSKNADLTTLMKEISALSQQVAEYAEEQSLPLLAKLSDAEREELNGLLDRRGTIQLSIEAAEGTLMQSSRNREKLRADLANNLMKRKGEIETRLLAITSGGSNLILPPPTAPTVTSGKATKSTRAAAAATAAAVAAAQKSARNFEGSLETRARDIESELATLQTERSHVLTQIETLEGEMKEIDDLTDKKKAELAAYEKSVDSLKTSELSLHGEIAEGAKMQDKLLNKRTMLLDIVQSKQRLIRDLGTLPRKELEDYKILSDKALLTQLKDVNDRLKKYSSVNRKALDQYVSFSEQRDTLNSRKDELDRDNQAIQQLIDTLDTQKEEAILRTFRGVSHHFSEVFLELVPGGEGSLVMKTAFDEDSSAAFAVEDSEEGVTETKSSSQKVAKKKSSTSSSSQSAQVIPSAATAVSSFQGVQVQVKFTGTGQMFDMQQLSGGQKALVALALIFAIQRCDPAPFYLFDEIDQALDANYRAGVARLIQKQVESQDAPAQFITTSFRPELVSVANKCYGIALQNKVSNIYPLERADAQNFVLNIMHEEEALGQVSSVPNFPRSLPSSAVLQPSIQENEGESGSDADDDEDDADQSDDDNEARRGEFEQAELALRELAVDDKVSRKSIGPADKEDENDDDSEEEEKKSKPRKRVASGSRKR